MNKLSQNFLEEMKLGLGHLEYSLQKAKKLSSNSRELDVEELEVWESFVARFSRLSDIFLSKFIRAEILNFDPGFRGTFRDFLDSAEKHGLLSSADEWMVVRELRNKTAHEYTRDDLSDVFKNVLRLSPFVIREIKKHV